MYKIFIDTNIFLDFYRYNSNDNILEIEKEFKKYKNYFINTQQSYDEFYRNRERTINEFIETLKKQIIPIYNGNFLSSLSGFNEYVESVKMANCKIDNMVKKSKECY